VPLGIMACFIRISLSTQNSPTNDESLSAPIVRCRTGDWSPSLKAAGHHGRDRLVQGAFHLATSLPPRSFRLHLDPCRDQSAGACAKPGMTDVYFAQFIRRRNAVDLSAIATPGVTCSSPRGDAIDRQASRDTAHRDRAAEREGGGTGSTAPLTLVDVPADALPGIMMPWRTPSSSTANRKVRVSLYHLDRNAQRSPCSANVACARATAPSIRPVHFIAAFFGCAYAALLPRTIAHRIRRSLREHCRASLSASRPMCSRARARRGYRRKRDGHGAICAHARVRDGDDASRDDAPICGASRYHAGRACSQYTSGSTSAPKGVMSVTQTCAQPGYETNVKRT
jgi:hypothetical protein